jgi:hypothetical protein
MPLRDFWVAHYNSTLTEDLVNHNFFFDKPIVGQSLEGRAAPEQANPGTSVTLQAIAKTLPEWAPDILRSPVRLESLIRGYTSTLGMQFLAAADGVTRAGGGYGDAPSKDFADQTIGRFVKTGQPRSTKWINEMYRMLKQANATAQSIKSLQDSGNVARAQELAKKHEKQLEKRGHLNSRAKAMRDLNARARAIESSRFIKGDEKQKQLDRINAIRNTIVRQVAPYAELF